MTHDVQEPKEGDLIEAVLGECLVRGRVAEHKRGDAAGRLYVAATGDWLGNLRTRGFAISVIARKEGIEMSNFTIGDLVEARRGQRRVVDLVTEGFSYIGDPGLHLGDPVLLSTSSLASYEAAGYSLTLIEAAAKPPLPKGVVRWPRGPVAAWTDNGLHWMITGSERAWGDPEEIIKQFGPNWQQIA